MVFQDKTHRRSELQQTEFILQIFVAFIPLVIVRLKPMKEIVFSVTSIHPRTLELNALIPCFSCLDATPFT